MALRSRSAPWITLAGRRLPGASTNRGPRDGHAPPTRHRARLGLGRPAFIGPLALVACVLVLPWLVRTDPNAVDLEHRLSPPVLLGGIAAHPLGTDQLGRDLLGRLLVGARLSLLIGVVGTVLAGLAGVLLGLAAGYSGGWIDWVVTWLADVQLAIPFVVVGISVVALLGNSLQNLLAILVVTGWVGYSRIVRLQTRALRGAPYVEAARALGAGRARILFRHLFPNLVSPILVIASQQVAALILYESALSYLGLGVPPEVITWGRMVADGRESLLVAWWVSAVPGAAIALTVLAFNLSGDWFLAALDPRTTR